MRYIKTQITLDTPLAALTLGQLVEFLGQHPRSIGAAAMDAPKPVPERRYVYGLRGIMQLFNVSNMTAQRYKRTIIREAVFQNGRKIVVDADRALELFAASREEQK